MHRIGLVLHHKVRCSLRSPASPTGIAGTCLLRDRLSGVTVVREVSLPEPSLSDTVHQSLAQFPSPRKPASLYAPTGNSHDSAGPSSVDARQLHAASIAFRTRAVKSFMASETPFPIPFLHRLCPGFGPWSSTSSQEPALVFRPIHPADTSRSGAAFPFIRAALDGNAGQPRLENRESH